MDRQRLLSYGFMLKELPPPFNSVLLEKAPKISTKFKSNCVEYTIPKGQFSRRLLQIPHPTSYIKLVDHICDNYELLETHFEQSKYSQSKIFDNKRAGSNVSNSENRALQTNYDTVNDWKEQILLESYDYLVELKIDIANFYPTIYTHSLAWALLTRETAKKMHNAKISKKLDHELFSTEEKKLYEFADLLDKYTRYLQDNQSTGIPVGPDTSHILAEIITTHIDFQLSKEFNNLKAFRYIDDYYVYVNSIDEAQRILVFFEKIFSDFQLSINESKVKIQHFPFGFLDSWVKEIHDVQIEDDCSASIKQYFNTLFTLVQANPQFSSTIFTYGMRTFERRTTIIKDENWLIFESLLLKSLLIESSLLEIASRVFETYKALLSKDKINIVLVKILDQHSALNHHYEVSWVLWIFIQLRIELPYKYVDIIIGNHDTISILILLHLNELELVENGISLIQRNNILEYLDIQKNNWILQYEAIEVKKWLIGKHNPEYDSYLKQEITFYDKNAKIKIYDLPPRKSSEIRDALADISLDDLL